MNDKNKIIDKCIESEAMREYLKTQNLKGYYLTEIITGSPISLEEKLKLYPLIDDEHAKVLCAETQKAIEELKLKPGEVFCLSECWYDEEILDEKVEFSEPFITFEAVIEHVREMMKDEEWDENTECWTYIEKWVPDENGKMKCDYAYYLIKDKVVYFGLDDYPSHHQCQGYVSSVSLNLPIPFEVGDIVVLNCLPFAPVRFALLTESENVDCCGVWMLYRDTDGEWKTRALKHGHGWNHHYPLLSPLYRLEKLEFSAKKIPELLKDDKYMADEKELHLLKDLQQSIRKISTGRCNYEHK